MKYPQIFNISLEKKNKFCNIKIIHNLKGLFKTNNIKIARKLNDCRSGIEYKATNLKEYNCEVEIELTRLDSIKKNVK